MDTMRVLTIFGTRPEAIKLAPVIKELEKRSDQVLCKTCVTGQHRELLDQVLQLFEIVPDYDLNVMAEGQSPTQVAALVMSNLEGVLDAEKPDWVLVEGDTTTAVAASLAAFHARVKVGHVEAGLRTGAKWQPFPEEIHRRLISVMADMHFAPTQRACQNLRWEGVPPERIVITGNPVIDALRSVADLAPTPEVDRLLERLNEEREDRIASDQASTPSRIILVTTQRRENLGMPLENICAALKEIVAKYEGSVSIVYPAHLSPEIWAPVHRMLGEVPHIDLMPPLDYLSLVHVMKRCHLVLTDSGGIQEEAPGLGKPVLVLRELTERPEAVKAGTVRMVGTVRNRIVDEVERLLDDVDAYQSMTGSINPYGDGHAAERIVGALLGEKVTPFQSG
jgi:UDP-N-acetylglucosamine 2-epimerase (non-hydrolysing)